MRERDDHKRKAIKFNSAIHWEKYKSMRNKVNTGMRKTKADFYHREIGHWRAKLNDLKENLVANKLSCWKE
jgi:hypothetical protein